MARFNAFNQIHKALRALLYDTAITLQRTDFTEEKEAAIAVQKVEQVNFLFHQHAHHEDHFILPIIKRYSPALSEEFEKEHEKDESLSHRLSSLLMVYSHAVSNNERRDAGYSICQAFNEFTAFNLYHMNKEEEKINAILWEYYNDAEIVAINQRIVASIPQDEMAVSSKWMMRGLSNLEIVTWLKNIKNGAPEFVFRSLLKLAESELPEDRWYHIKEGIIEGAMVA